MKRGLMKSWKFLALVGTLAGVLSFAQAPEAPWQRARDLISQTQADLREARTSSTAEHKDRDRYKNAERHLSTFDRHMVKRHFDKGELDDAIGDVQGVLDHNTLTPEGRNALLRDVAELRRLRADYDSWRH
ncbi:MAG TPA: hypothetical protein VLT57_19685 [Bryobacteraceae bacterium]|nr:hypothetical protein [Bryobacteraceae bacterium]